MSIAGVRSSQGDSFQSLVAARYAVEMIYTPELREIEVDATSLDPSGNPPLVDDVIVRYNDSVLYIQAKKNQTDFRAWSLGDLGDELRKAWIQWRRDPSARLLFISRNDFGDIAKLKEHATTQPTSEAFERSLTIELRGIADRVLSNDEQAGSIADLYAFLHQLSFETISLERFRGELIGQLRLHVAHAQNGFESIKKRIDAISRRETEQGGLKISPHSLNRQELFDLLRSNGVEVCLPMADQNVVRSLSQLSQIGRNWQRKIGESQLPRSVVSELLERIRHKPSCLLLVAGRRRGRVPSPRRSASSFPMRGEWALRPTLRRSERAPVADLPTSVATGAAWPGTRRDRTPAQEAVTAPTNDLLACAPNQALCVARGCVSTEQAGCLRAVHPRGGAQRTRIPQLRSV